MPYQTPTAAQQLPYLYPSANSLVPYMYGPTPAQMLPYMYPSQNSLLPYTMGPTPQQQIQDQLSQLKTVAPWVLGPTPYQQGQLSLDQQKLTAQEQQWQAQDMLRQEQIMGYDAQGNPTLARQKFNEQQTMDQAKIQEIVSKAQNTAYKDQAANIGRELSSINSSISSVLGNPNMTEAQRQSALTELYAQRDSLFSQLDQINAALGGSSDGGSGGGLDLYSPN